MSNEAPTDGGDGQVPEERTPIQSAEGDAQDQEGTDKTKAESDVKDQDGPNDQKKKSDKGDKKDEKDEKDKKDADEKDNDENEHEQISCQYLWQISRSILLFCLGGKIACELTGCVLIPSLERMR